MPALRSGRHHLLVIGEALLVEHGDDDRAMLGLGLELREMGECDGEPRHANGKSRRRHRLAAKGATRAVVTATAADRAEARRAVLAAGGECQLNFNTGRLIF